MKQVGIFKFDSLGDGEELSQMKAGSLFGGVTVTFPVPVRRLNKKLYKGGKGMHILFRSDEGETWRVIVKQERVNKHE